METSYEFSAYCPLGGPIFTRLIDHPFTLFSFFSIKSIQERISSFGWDTKMVDGHDMKSIRDSFNDMDGDKPLCIILDTIKGKGVSFMEHPDWHCKVPTDKEYEIAMKELGV